MAVDDSRPADAELQFDRVVSNAPNAATGAPAVTCVACKKAIDSRYYHMNGKNTCANCRTEIEASIATPTDVGSFLRSLALGILAAFAGAAVYYAVLRAGVEIAIIAIGCGYAIGWAIKKGNGNRGGLRFQVMAVILTYWSIGLAYLPLFMGAQNVRITPFLLLYSFELPVLVITHEGMSAILSVIIIGLGLRYAWQMTAAPKLAVSGPYRVGGDQARPNI